MTQKVSGTQWHKKRGCRELPLGSMQTTNCKSDVQESKITHTQYYAVLLIFRGCTRYSVKTTYKICVIVNGSAAI